MEHPQALCPPRRRPDGAGDLYNNPSLYGLGLKTEFLIISRISGNIFVDTLQNTHTKDQNYDLSLTLGGGKLMGFLEF